MGSEVAKPGPDFTEGDCYPIVDAIWRWIEIRKANGYQNFPTHADFRKSRLLLRLFQGKEPYPEPPPTAHAGPWYELLDYGEATLGDIFIYFPPEVRNGSRPVQAGDVLNICANIGWTIRAVEPTEPLSYEVEHPRAPGVWDLTRTTVESVALAGYATVGGSLTSTSGIVRAIRQDPAKPGVDILTVDGWLLKRREPVDRGEPAT